MRRMAIAIAISALLLPLSPADAKEDKFGSVLDVLSGVLGNPPMTGTTDTLQWLSVWRYLAGTQGAPAKGPCGRAERAFRP